MTQRLGRKRLSVDIPEMLHDGVKLCAKARNITITRWVLRAINDRLKKETKYDDDQDYSKGVSGL